MKEVALPRRLTSWKSQPSTWKISRRQARCGIYRAGDPDRYQPGIARYMPGDRERSTITRSVGLRMHGVVGVPARPGTCSIAAIHDRDNTAPTSSARSDPSTNTDSRASGLVDVAQALLPAPDRRLAFVDHSGGVHGGTELGNRHGEQHRADLQPGPGGPDRRGIQRQPQAAGGWNSPSRAIRCSWWRTTSTQRAATNHFSDISGRLFLSEVQRLQQAQVVHDFAAAILTADPNANVVVLGDLNDFRFSQPGYHAGRHRPQRPGQYAAGGGALYLRIRGQFRDPRPYPGGQPHLCPSIHVRRRAVNSEFAVRQASDHDPQVSPAICGRDTPTLTVSVWPDVLWPPNHKYVTVEATVSVKDNASRTQAGHWSR